MGLKTIRKEYQQTPSKELIIAGIENYVYGLIGSIIVVFISARMDLAVLISYMCFYFFLGRVINRPKYVTSLGKFIMFPIPASLGAFTGYKLGWWLSQML